MSQKKGTCIDLRMKSDIKDLKINMSKLLRSMNVHSGDIELGRALVLIARFLVDAARTNVTNVE